MALQRQILSRIKLPTMGSARLVWVNDWFSITAQPIVNNINVGNGTAFQNAELKVYNGTTWQACTAQVYYNNQWYNLN